MNQQNTIFGSKETKKLSEKLIPGLKKGKKQKEEKEKRKAQAKVVKTKLKSQDKKSPHSWGAPVSGKSKSKKPK